ncbi:NAD(P)/FAD-dependent oxidoreductase [[Mycobacterium] burgundiense]|uniref:FAD-dependent oxidoreductase n=1 Tax=[Mycobacterium] burgundiense TaxID=3064286 RepID=A0ABN9NSF3_9MYCO|nr:FAD-dependent oxidoreductase [Mycolicibacterium sp. MU0053]CAJ1511181.1 FAD-dependent oxidoreductase [Mycolicibacterium sp. MU0053]
MTRDTIVLIGAGLASIHAAETLRAEGFDGKVLLFSEEDHPPYDRPPLSKGIITGAVSVSDCSLRLPSWYSDNRVDLVLGARVDALDAANRTIRLASGEVIHFDLALLATGARIRWPGRLCVRSERVCALRTLDDALAIRSQLVPGATVAVVGGGFIGAELASSARALGCEVIMFEAAPAPFQRTLGHTVGAMFAEFYATCGVAVMTDVPIAELCTAAGGVRITATDGRAWDVDVAVIGVGVDPNVELAAAAGLRVADGVEVDERCTTSAPHVYAAGDVARRPDPIFGGRTRVEHWQNAQHQGIAAARAMMGSGDVMVEVPWFWSDQFGSNVQVAGSPQRADRVLTRGSLSSDAFTAYYLHGTALVATLGVNAVKEVHLGRRLIGERATLDIGVLSDGAAQLGDAVTAPRVPMK